MKKASSFKKIGTIVAWFLIASVIMLFFFSMWPWMILVTLAYLIYKRVRNSQASSFAQNEFKTKLLLIVLSLAFALSITEIALRWDGRQGWREGKYSLPSRLLYTFYTPFHQLFIYEYDGWLRAFKQPAGTVMKECNQEFCQTTTVNAEGCNDKEWSLKKSKKYRIACLGDSFTEGIGSTPDSTFENVWQKLDTAIEVMNCGIRGSDPVLEFKLLEDRIFKYQPDMVLMSVNNSDWTDILDRGGFERFLPNNRVVSEKTPWWFFAYGSSYLVRLVVHHLLHFDYSLRSPKEVPLLTAKALGDLHHAIDTTAQECQKRNIRFVVNFHPTVQEFTLRKIMELDTMVRGFEQTPLEAIDMHRYFVSQGIDSANAQQYYWQLDGHHNNRGYALFARGLHHLIP